MTMTTSIVIVGGGFGGLEAAFSLRKLLGRTGAITLIDRSTYHSFIPSIHLIVSGRVSAEEIRIPLKAVLGVAGIRFVKDEALSVNMDKREVNTGGGSVPYDYLVLSGGAENNFFGIPGAEEFSFAFRTPEDALRIRAKLMQLIAEESVCRLVLAGAGTEGVEVAGELLDLIREEGREEDLKSDHISVEMIEGKTRLLPDLPREAQDRAEEYLKRGGVTVIAGDRIVEVRSDAVVLASGLRRAASILIWTGGIQPSRLVRDLVLAKDPRGWLKVTDRLHAPEDERVYAIGDAVSIYTNDGPLELQRLAYNAQDQARVAAFNIVAKISGRDLIAYKPKIRPQLISIGRGSGIFTFKDRVYSGPWVVSLKKAVERNHLMTYLAKPVSSVIWSWVPGARGLQRLRLRLPV